MSGGVRLKDRTVSTIFFVAVSVWFTKVLFSILIGFANYFPPNFKSGFLLGRDDYFFGIYQYAFYAHLFFGPTALLLGTVLFLQGKQVIRFRPRIHKCLGRCQALVVLLGVVPSGLIMGAPKFVGIAASSGLIALAVATGCCMFLAIAHAMNRDVRRHGEWAVRCYLLLLSPLILRILSGVFLVVNVNSDAVFATLNWVSWLTPLMIYEIWMRHRNTGSELTTPSFQRKEVVL